MTSQMREVFGQNGLNTAQNSAIKSGHERLVLHYEPDSLLVIPATSSSQLRRQLAAVYHTLRELDLHPNHLACA